MKIAVLGNDASCNELMQCNKDITWLRATDLTGLFNEKDAGAYFILQENVQLLNTALPDKPVFINSVVNTLQEINAADNIIRINGWAGFMAKELWEVCGILSETAINVLNQSGKKFVQVPDIPGFISARIISMIINEAYYAAGENVSSEKAIDIAMKLGTNYPHGPFEWANIIGVKNIYTLLQKLSVKDTRYTAAPALVKIINL